jgi:hypothetical protein
VHAHARIIFGSRSGDCAGGRAGIERRNCGVWQGRKVGIGRTTQSTPYGPNNEQLPKKLEGALRRLVYQFSFESEGTRRQEVRRIKQAHQFWRGLQYLWWNERDQNWHLPFEQKLSDNSTLEDLPRYEFVTNIYQAFGLSLVALLSQDVPRVRFFPSSAQAEQDVAAAKAATEVAQLVERNNRIGILIVEEAFNLWTDGKVGAYVRFVVDGQRSGFHPETESGAREAKIGSDVSVRPECGAENTAKSGAPDRSGVRPAGKAGRGDDDEIQKHSADGLEPNAGEVSDTNIGRCCDTCGALLTEEDFVAAEMVTVPTAETRRRVPNGQEVVNDCWRPGIEDSALG